MKEGDKVFIKKFNRNGLIQSVLPKNQFKVSLGSMSVVVAESELSVAIESDKSSQARTARGISITRTESSSAEGETIDLHGMTVAQALDALEQKINRAILANTLRLKVVHGFGSGKVMVAVHQYLTASSLVANFRVDDLNPGQTWVWL